MNAEYEVIWWIGRYEVIRPVIESAVEPFAYEVCRKCGDEATVIGKFDNEWSAVEYAEFKDEGDRV